jgi:hypothetical protein
VIRQFGFNNTQQEFLHSNGFVHDAAAIDIFGLLRFEVFSLRREFGDDVSLLLRPFDYRHWTAYQHKVIVGCPHLIGHNVLEMQPEKPPP